MDAWLVAFKIPNFLRRLFAEGSFSQAFVPVISEYKSKRSKDEARELVDSVAGTFGVLLFVVTLVRRDRRAAHHPGVRAELAQRARQVAPGDVDAALDVPVPVLHLAERAVLRRAQQLRQVRAARVHAGDHERGHDHRGAVDRATHRQSGRGARHGCVRQRPAAARIPGARGDAPRPVPLAALASGRRWRAAHRPADVAGRIRLVGGAGQPAARHADRDLPDHRQRVVAVLRGPAHGISARRVQHRAGHRDPSRSFAASRR